MNEKILNNINDVLSNNKNIILIPHSSPDADALGSCLGLYHFLKMKIMLVLFSPNEYTDILNFLPGSKKRNSF
jgi:phosphoesterase RecJ-like protein